MVDEIIKSNAPRSDIVRISDIEPEVPEAGLIGGTLALGGVQDAPIPGFNSSNIIQTESPTYGYIDAVGTGEGKTIPVNHGIVAFFPQTIGFYIDLDSVTNNMWAHFLLCVGEGETNQVITENDIYLGDQILTTFDSSSYILQANNGSNFPTTSSSITSLLHFDGANGSTTFTDESGKTWTVFGGAEIDTTTFKFGTASGLFVRSTDSWIQTPNDTDFDVGAGEFTVHCWVNKITSLSSAISFMAIFGQSSSDGTDHAIICRFIEQSGGDMIEVLLQDDTSAATVYTITGATGLSDNFWNHIALVRSTNTMTLYINGVADGTVDLTGVTVNASINKFGIGIAGEIDPTTSASVWESFDGRVEEFVYMKGIAKWTADFPVPSGPSVFGTGGIFNDKFSKVHQYTNFDRQLLQSEEVGPSGQTSQTTPMSSLLHLDSEVSALPNVVEETKEDHDWELFSGATISASSPKFGAGCLDLNAASSYLASTNNDTFDLMFVSKAPVTMEWDIEMFYEYTASAPSSALIGGEVAYDSSDGYAWGLFFIGGVLQFQMYRIEAGVPTTIIHDVSFDTLASSAASSDELFPSVWYHIRVANDLQGVVYLAVDGDQKTTSTQVFPTWSFTGTPTYTNRIGWAKRKEGASIVEYFGDGRIDEFRMLNGGLMRAVGANFSVPTVPYTFTSTKKFTSFAEIDSFAFVIMAKRGLFFSETDGSLSTASVNFKISYRKEGTSAWTIVNRILTAATVQPYAQRFEISVASRGIYEFLITRLTEDKLGQTQYMTDTWLIGMDEILNELLSYPNAQCVSLSIEAQDVFSGQIPNIRTIAKRTNISVPTFDNTSTRLVDPRNNMFAAFDMLTNNLYGPGFLPTNLVEADWTAWQTYCDVAVSGSSRCRFNMTHDAGYDFLKALQFVETSGRARIINKGMKLGVIIDQPGTASYIFNVANINPATSILTFITKKERSDAVEIQYIDSTKNWTIVPVIHPSANFESLTTVPRIIKIAMQMVATNERARRDAILKQQISEGITRAISIDSGLEAIGVIKGDIISYAHPGSPKVFGGRIDRDASGSDAYTGTTIYLDQAITLDTATYSGNAQAITRNKDTDVLTTHTITGPFDIETNAFVVSASATFNRFEPYIVGRVTGEIYDYKVSSVQRTSNQSVRIEAVQYTQSSYFHVDFGGGVVAI